MALVLKDRIKETCTTAGTGTLTLDGAADGFQAFSVVGSGSITYYGLINGSTWEVGSGTYSSNTLTRDTVLESSNSGSKIVLSGTSYVFCTYPAEKSVYKNSNDQVQVPDSGLLFSDNTTTTSANRSYVSATGDLNVTATTDVVFIDSSSSTISLYLPLASGNGGKVLSMKYISGTNSITVVPSGSETIDSGSSYVFYNQKEAISLISNNTSWYII